MEKFNSLPNVFPLGFYHPKFDYYEDNEYFNEYSQKILNLKDNDSEAIRFFTKELDKIIDDEQVVITAVPSSDATCISSGIVYLSKQLVQSKQNLIDGTICVQRIKSLVKQSNSCEKKTKTIHKYSMEIQNKSLIKEQKVILLDDVLTTGNTVKACQELLLEAGAKEVKIIVLGKTIRDLDYYYHLLESQYPIFINKIYKEIDKERDRKWKELHNSYQIKHQEIDEWADNEHQELNYFDPDDDYGHDCIDQQAKEKYNCLNYEEENKASYIDQEAETIKAGEYENYSHLKDEIYDAINGCSCLSPSNPFLTLFLN